MYHQQYKGLYACPRCGVDFRTQHGLAKHRRDNDCSTFDVNTCKMCLIRFRTVYKLKEHFRSEHAEALALFLKTGEDAEDCFGNFSVSDLYGIDEMTETPEDVMPSLIAAGASS